MTKEEEEVRNKRVASVAEEMWNTLKVSRLTFPEGLMAITAVLVVVEKKAPGAHTALIVGLMKVNPKLSGELKDFVVRSLGKGNG